MAVPALSLPFLFIFFSLILTSIFSPVVQGATWCVTRSDASYQALQTALDYACASGADCTPLQSDGLCFLPNTIQAHASYAFNSYYQRRANAPGSCDFAGTATVARTDPSYGSCMYPSSQSTAGGGIPTPTTATNNPNVPPTTVANNPYAPPATATTPPLNGGDGSTGLSNPGLTPPVLPNTADESRASFECMIDTSTMSILLLLVLSCILCPIWIF